MTYPLRVAVFCGYSDSEFSDKRSNEALFAYRVLKLISGEKLDINKDRLVAANELTNASNYDTPLFKKFNFFGLPSEELNFTQHIVKELSDDKYDYALVIMPKRKCGHGANNECERVHTTSYVPMECALAEGVGKCPVVVIEAGLPVTEVPLVTRKVNASITQEMMEKDDISHEMKKLINSFQNLEQQALKSSKMHFGRTELIENFYQRFCRYILTAQQVQIFNHSLLPLGGNFDQNDTGTNEPSGNKLLCARDLYFELEEMLLSESSERINRLIVAASKREWCVLEEAINQRIAKFSQSDKKAFGLRRVVSVPDAALFEKNVIPQNVENRYTSLFQQIGRIEKRQAESTKHHKEARLHIHYTLAAFQTRTLHSFPTTVHITHENGARSCIWGFLRSDLEKRAEKDHFIVARNETIVDVFRQHVEMFFGEDIVSNTFESQNEPLEYLLESEGWNSDSVHTACAKLACLINRDEVCVEIAKKLQKNFYQPEPGFAAWMRSAVQRKPRDCPKD